jgi:hypothetical protein
MKNPKLEPIQQGNPHNLTLYQHIMPRASIERFCNADKTVYFKKNDEQSFRRLFPKNRRFCAERVWDQKAETVLSRDIENSFQSLADKLITGVIKSISTELQTVVTDMYLLWRTRFLYAKEPIDDIEVFGINPERELTKDRQEELEKWGVIFVRPDGRIPSRTFTGVLMLRDMDRAHISGADKMQWGVCHAPAGLEFLCSDASINQPILPVSPSICLVSGLVDSHITPYELGNINRELLKGVQNYWFARTPNKCIATRRNKLVF